MSGPGNPVCERKKSALEEAVDQLRREISEHHSMADIVKSRLSSVLLPEGPEVAPGPGKPMPPELVSPIVNQIRRLREEMARSNDGYRRLLDRLET